MHTRTLTGLAITLAAAGLTSAGIGMHVTHTAHPVIGGIALILAAIVPATMARTRGDLTPDQRAAERAAGYRQGLMHAALGLLDTTSTRVDSDDTGRTQQ